MEPTAPKKEMGCQDISAEDLKAVFKFLDEAEIHQLCRYLEVRDLPAEATLMVEGEHGDFMGFLVQGRLAVKKETPFPGKYILLAILDPGTMVGEIAAMEQGRRNTTIIAMEPCRLLILTHQRMDELISENMVLGTKMLRRIVRVLSLRLQMADDRLARLL